MATFLLVNLVNRSYQPADILVLTGYDLTKLKKIFLSIFTSIKAKIKFND